MPGTPGSIMRGIRGPLRCTALAVLQTLPSSSSERAHPETGAGAPALAAGFLGASGPGAPALAAGLAAGFLAGAGEAAGKDRRFSHFLGNAQHTGSCLITDSSQPIRLVAQACPFCSGDCAAVEVRCAKAHKQEVGLLDWGSDKVAPSRALASKWRPVVEGAGADALAAGLAAAGLVAGLAGAGAAAAFLAADLAGAGAAAFLAAGLAGAGVAAQHEHCINSRSPSPHSCC
jgi:hypothetical protein